MKNKASPDPQRQLMIKTKMCQRLMKEVAYYEQEVEENRAKLKEMKEQHKNPFDIKKFEEVLGESQMMVPDSKKRLQQALSDLSTYLNSGEVRTMDSSNEWQMAAQGLLREQDYSTSSRLGDSDDNAVEETDVSGVQDGEAF